MRLQTISLTLFLTASLLAFAVKDQSVQDLIARAQSVRPEDRPALYVEIMELQIKNADQLYREGKPEAALAAINDATTYSDKAHDAAIAVPKKIKNTEIAFRKSAAKLRDIKRTLNFGEQPPVQSASDHIEQLRSDLLAKMFSKN